MQMDQLKYFIEVVNKGSINLACEGLHISQQALSQSMRNVEKEMGYTLLLRSHKGIVLTEKGQAFFEAAVDIVDRWEKLMAELNEDALTGTVRIAIAPYIEDYYYTALLRFVQKYHLPVQLDIVNYPLEKAVQALENAEIDLAAVSLYQNMVDDFLRQHTDLVFIPKKQITYNILVSKQSLLSKEAVVEFKDLKNQRIIIEKSEQDAEYIQRFLADNPFDEVLCVSSFYAKQSMVANNLGVSIGIEGGFILSNYDGDLVEIPLQGYENLLSGILLCHKDIENKLLKEILKAW